MTVGTKAHSKTARLAWQAIGTKTGKTTIAVTRNRNGRIWKGLRDPETGGKVYALEPTERSATRAYYGLRPYKFRTVTAREREKLADLIRTVCVWGEEGVTIRIEVRNKRNSNGYWIEWEPGDRTAHWTKRGQVKVTRFISRAWAEAHGYRW